MAAPKTIHLPGHASNAQTITISVVGKPHPFETYTVESREAADSLANNLPGRVFDLLLARLLEHAHFEHPMAELRRQDLIAILQKTSAETASQVK